MSSGTASVAAGDTESTGAAIERDARDLRRSFLINLLGYAVKLAHPFLLILVIRLYGAGAFGIFALSQAILGVLVRVALLGLDKGLLWWVPRQTPADERVGLRAVLVLTTAASIVLATATAVFLAPVLADWADRPDITESLRWMALGLVPMCVMEVLCQAAVGKRHLEAHIIAKEGVVWLTQVVAALVFYALGMVASGLALSFFVSYALGLVAVFFVFTRAFAASRGQHSDLHLPMELWRYSWPMWLSELAMGLYYRLDMFILAALTDKVAVGIFAGAVQYSGNVMAIRASFDPMMTAVISQIGYKRDLVRLRRGFAHAWLLVASLQIPLVALLVVGAAWVMPLLGEQYVAGVTPALILILLYSLHGLFGLNQHIISGYGHSRLTLMNILIATAAAAALLYLLIPPYGVSGAAWGIGLAYGLLNLLWAIEARIILGAWHYERSIGAFLLLTAVAGGCMAVGWWLLGSVLGEGVTADIVARVAALGVFAAVFVPGLMRLRRSVRVAEESTG